ncbi:MAG TPA: hypothetical protein PKD27_05535, partial [Tepidiformaceae bacterium]|nr:hypothetical protein [Tepidiformaceae bacterium]
NLKYRRYQAIAPLMAEHLREAVRDIDVDGWYAVPLHRSRQRERGFNQAALLLNKAGLPGAPGMLLRNRKTMAQVGQHLAERRQNVAGAFAYSGPSLEGKRVGLLDDVITTGATVRECALVLRDAGAREVWAAGFTRASYDPEAPQPIDD